MVPTVEQIEEYIESLEELVFSSISIPEVPTVREAVNRIWVDISRYGPGLPSLPEIRIQGPGDLEVPPPPLLPPPPPQQLWLGKSVNWAGRHPFIACTGLAVGAIGAGLLAGYTISYLRSPWKRKSKVVNSTERRQAVVVLGGDTPLGLPLILELEKKGYVVITSVSTPEAVQVVESKGHGYVRALVLDPSDVLSDSGRDAITLFLRSLTSSLSRRLPLAHPSSHPYIHAVISLLSLTPPPLPAPLEHLALRAAYVPYLGATHVAPLQVIQGLLPHLRTAPARTRDKGNKSIIICLPATAARVGLPFSSMQAMSAAATLRGADVLRREIDVASLTDKTESMKNIKVVVVDVGAFEVGKPSPSLTPQDAYKAMEDWTASEKVTYGPAFASVFRELPPPPPSYWARFMFLIKGNYPTRITRRGAGAEVFVNTILSLVSDRHDGAALFGFGTILYRLRSWVGRKRIVVGAGANTYRLASHLPPFLLDALLMIPHFLVSVRDALLPIQSPIARIPPPPGTESKLSVHSVSEPEDSGNNVSETSSEAEANSRDGVEDGSWVSLS